MLKRGIVILRQEKIGDMKELNRDLYFGFSIDLIKIGIGLRFLEDWLEEKMGIERLMWFLRV